MGLGSTQDLLSALSTSEHALEVARSIPLGLARPPNTSGVYALFFSEHLVYVGQASGSKGLLNRRNNYVSGDDGHTTHRQFLLSHPDKQQRRKHIEENVRMAWCELPDGLLAKAIERILIWRLTPPWNRD
jgi:hypothetical protein